MPLRILVYSLIACRRFCGVAKKKVLTKILEQHGKETFRKWSFFKIENSIYILDLVEDSTFVYEVEELEHYAIVTEDAIHEFVAAKDSLKVAFTHSDQLTVTREDFSVENISRN